MTEHYGRVRNFLGITPDLVRESKVHFDLLNEKYPDALLIGFFVTVDGWAKAEVRGSAIRNKEESTGR